MAKKRNTSGKKWLEHSMISFNGSGYADKTSPETYLKSYYAYKYMKRDNYALLMIEQNEKSIYNIAKLCLTLNEAGKKANPKQYQKFLLIYKP